MTIMKIYFMNILIQEKKQGKKGINIISQNFIEFSFFNKKEEKSVVLPEIFRKFAEIILTLIK